jgi:hypothetical protein
MDLLRARCACCVGAVVGGVSLFLVVVWENSSLGWGVGWYCGGHYWSEFGNYCNGNIGFLSGTEGDKGSEPIDERQGGAL